MSCLVTDAAVFNASAVYQDFVETSHPRFAINSKIILLNKSGLGEDENQEPADCNKTSRGQPENNAATCGYRFALNRCQLAINPAVVLLLVRGRF